MPLAGAGQAPEKQAAISVQFRVNKSSTGNVFPRSLERAYDADNVVDSILTQRHIDHGMDHSTCGGVRWPTGEAPTHRHPQGFAALEHEGAADDEH